MKRIVLILLVLLVSSAVVFAAATDTETATEPIPAEPVTAAVEPDATAAVPATAPAEPETAIEPVKDASRFTVALRAGYGSIFYSYRDKTTKAGENSGFNGFPLDVEFTLRFGQSSFGAMAVIGASVGRNYYDTTTAAGDITRLMGAFGKVMFDSYLSVYLQLPVQEKLDIRAALGLTLKVYEVKQLAESFPAVLLGAKFEGTVKYNLTSFLFVDAGLGLELGLINGATGKSTTVIKKEAFTFGWNLFVGAGIKF